MGKSLETELQHAGYRLLGAQENKEQLILNILKTNNIRYLKAIPFLIYQYNFNLETIYSQTNEKQVLGQIIEFTKKIFKESNIIKSLPNIRGKSNLNYEDFKQEFSLQQANLEKPQLLIEKQKVYAERDLQMWLSKLFTEKEKQTIQKIFEEKPVSRTDYEYYSRKTKKKLNAIIHLQELARTLNTRSPLCDDELFKLKKLLEKWLEEKKKYNHPSLQKFSVSHQWVTLHFQYKEKLLITEKSFTTRLKDINKEVLTILEKYKEHNFS